jgi:hypothetical protein
MRGRDADDSSSSNSSPLAVLALVEPLTVTLEAASPFAVPPTAALLAAAGSFAPPALSLASELGETSLLGAGACAGVPNAAAPPKLDGAGAICRTSCTAGENAPCGVAVFAGGVPGERLPKSEAA